MGRIAARREFRLRELATRPPSGKSRSGSRGSASGCASGGVQQVYFCEILLVLIQKVGSLSV